MHNVLFKTIGFVKQQSFYVLLHVFCAGMDLAVGVCVLRKFKRVSLYNMFWVEIENIYYGKIVCMCYT